MNDPLIIGSKDRPTQGKAYHQPRVEVRLFGRPDKTWFWRVRVRASHATLLGEHWCPRWSHMDVDGRDDNPRKRVAIYAGSIAEHQAAMYGSTNDPTEIAELAVEAYVDLCAELEKRHGSNLPAIGFGGSDE